MKCDVFFLSLSLDKGFKLKHKMSFLVIIFNDTNKENIYLFRYNSNGNKFYNQLFKI